MRTANRNIDYLKLFAERVILSREGNNYTGDDLNIIIRNFGTPKEIDSFFDKFTIAFGKWLLKRNERTLEHSVEELLEAFRDHLLTAPDDEQIDYVKREQKYSHEITHAPGSCPL
jgi:hypothetical protein